MGARQSKRSVDISAGATKAEKGPAGEPLENGTITAASVDEKQVVEANGGGGGGGAVEETPKQNGSTPHVNEKENNETSAAVAAPAEESKEAVKSDEEKPTEPAVPAAETNGDLDTTADESVKSPTEESAATTDEAEKKKRKKKKAWSFRSISFSKKDKSKPASKPSPTKTNEAVPEVAEDEPAKEEVTETTPAVETPKVEEEAKKEPEVNTTQTSEIPPPLPSSPPPVEVPIVEKTSAPVEAVAAPVETPAPAKPEEKPEIAQPEQTEDDTVGGGEGLAEPPEGLNTSDIEKEVAEVPLVNGNHIEHEESLPSSPNVESVTEKIEAIKISNIIESSEVHHEISHEVNGIKDDVAVSNEVSCAGSNCNGTDD